MAMPRVSKLKLNEYEYSFLKADMVTWPRWGAAFGVTMEFCQEHGLGKFGEPTEKGERLMKEYESGG